MRKYVLGFGILLFIGVIALSIFAVIINRRQAQAPESITPQAPSPGPAEIVKKTPSVGEIIDPNQERKDFLTISDNTVKLMYYRPAGFGLFSLDLTTGSETKISSPPLDLVQKLVWSPSQNKAIFQVLNQKVTLEASAPTLYRSELSDESLTWWTYDLETDNLDFLGTETIDAIIANDEIIIAQLISDEYQIVNTTSQAVIFKSKTIKIDKLITSDSNVTTIYGLFTLNGQKLLGTLDSTTGKIRKILENVLLTPLISPDLTKAIVQIPQDNDGTLVSLALFDLKNKTSNNLDVILEQNQLNKITWSRDSDTFYIASINPDENLEGDILQQFSLSDPNSPKLIETGVETNYNYLTLDEPSGLIYFVSQDRIYKLAIPN